MHYFWTLFWQRDLHVSDRFSVHHQESYYSIRSNRYFVMLADRQHGYWNCIVWAVRQLTPNVINDTLVEY